VRRSLHVEAADLGWVGCRSPVQSLGVQFERFHACDLQCLCPAGDSNR
jgi:hypothetical protein